MRASHTRLLAVLTMTGAAFIAVIALSSSVGAQAASPDAGAHRAGAQEGAKPAIVLVHGALVDAMGWSRVITRLQRKGYYVTAVENPLTSFEADVATTKRVIDAQKGRVVVVGHSYGGAVITAAAAGNANVAALVYVAALAPDAGETITAFSAKYPAPVPAAFVPDAAGFLTTDRAKFRSIFAQDIPAAEADVLAAAQKPINSASFKSSIETAAWRTIPSWYLVARQDHAINPDLERFYAKRMSASTTEIDSGHLPFLSHPEQVVRLIEAAAVAPGRAP